MIRKLMPRPLLICILLTIVFLCACQAKYPPVTDIENSALLKFESDKYKVTHLSSMQFYHVGYKYRCGDSLRQAKYLAKLTDREPFPFPNKYTDEIRVETKDPFRIFVNHSAGSRDSGYGNCNMIFSFPTEKGKVYKILPKSSFVSLHTFFRGTEMSYTCSVEVLEIADKNGPLSRPKKVDFSEYTDCPSRY